MTREKYKTILRNETTGEDITFPSISAAGIRINASTKTIRKAQKLNRSIRARDNTLWSVKIIEDQTCLKSAVSSGQQ